MSRAEALGRNVLWFTLFVSLAGFLGYYDADGFVAPPPVIVFGLQILGAAVGAVLLRAHLRTNLRAVMPLVLVAAWAAASLFWAEDSTTALRRWFIVFAPGLAICVLAAADPRPHQTFRWVIALVIAIVLASGLFSGIVIAFWDTTIPENALRYLLLDLNGWKLGVAEGGRQYQIGFYIPRYSGLTSNPNSISLFAGIATIALAALAQPLRERKGVGFALVAGLIVFLLLLSGSRASFAMVAAGLFFVLVLRSGHPRIARLSVFLICALTFALYFFTWSNSPEPQSSPTETKELSEKYAEAVESGHQYEAWRIANQIASLPHTEVLELRERSDAWHIAIETIRETWAIGRGFGLTEEASYHPRGLQTSAYSVTLSVLIEIGIIGLILVLIAWLAPVFAVTRHSSSMSPPVIAIVAILMGLFVHQVVDSSVFRYHWAHFIFVYLLGAGARLSTSRATE